MVHPKAALFFNKERIKQKTKALLCPLWCLVVSFSIKTKKYNDFSIPVSVGKLFLVQWEQDLRWAILAQYVYYKLRDKYRQRCETFPEENNRIKINRSPRGLGEENYTGKH